MRAAGGICSWQAQVRSTAVRILTRSHGVDDAQGVVKAPQVKTPQPQPLWQQHGRKEAECIVGAFTLALAADDGETRGGDKIHALALPDFAVDDGVA